MIDIQGRAYHVASAIEAYISNLSVEQRTNIPVDELEAVAIRARCQWEWHNHFYKAKMALSEEIFRYELTKHPPSQPSSSRVHASHYSSYITSLADRARAADRPQPVQSPALLTQASKALRLLFSRSAD